MIEIQDNKLFINDQCLQFSNKLIEVAEYENKIIVVFETDEDGGYDNVFCYTLESNLLWRIKQAPIEIGGTARSAYVGVDIVEGNCRVIDFFGRRFVVNINNGEIISKDIVR